MWLAIRGKEIVDKGTKHWVQQRPYGVCLLSLFYISVTRVSLQYIQYYDLQPQFLLLTIDFCGRFSWPFSDLVPFFALFLCTTYFLPC